MGISELAGSVRQWFAVAKLVWRRERLQAQLRTQQQETCPHCGAEHQTPRHPHLFRYPVYVCAACVRRATDADGRAVVLCNVGLSGGFEAVHRADESRCRSVTESFVAYIDGKPYYADEMRFGGIVVQPIGALPRDCRRNFPG